MQTNTRRTLLKAAVAISAAPATIFAIEPAIDPIIDAIKRFRDGLKAYREYPLNEDSDEDAVADELYGQHEAVLMSWDKPATTAAGAAEALRLAREETRYYANSPTANAMLAAAIGYFESA